LDHRFDRFYSFDQVSRLKEALSGAEARGEPATTNRPYKQTYGYDAFNHLTARTNKVWWTSDNSLADTYVNNRRVQWQYDADGRLLNGNNAINTYDAAGHTTHIEIPSTYSSHATFGLDGDGRQIKTEETTWNEELQTEVTETKYYVRSTVLGGQVLSELENVYASRTFVYAGSSILAWQWRTYGYEVVDWEHKDPSGASVRRGGSGQELDPLGGDAGTHAQTQIPDEGAFAPYGSSYSAANPSITYSMDGIRLQANDFWNLAEMALQDSLRVMEWFARAGSRPVTRINAAAGALGTALAPAAGRQAAPAGALGSALVPWARIVRFVKKAEFNILGKTVPFYIATEQTEEYERKVLETARQSVDLLNSNSHRLTAEDKEVIANVNAIAAIGMLGWEDQFWVEGIEGVAFDTIGMEGILMKQGVFLTGQIYTTPAKYWVPQIAHEGQHRHDVLTRTGGAHPDFTGDRIELSERRALNRQLNVYRRLFAIPLGTPPDPYEQMLIRLIGSPHRRN
jgi:hypothetical protein